MCCVCMRSLALCLSTFGPASGIDANWIGAVAIGVIYRTSTGDRRVPAYGKGTRDLVVQFTSKASASVARTMLQPVFDEARLAARTCTHASSNNEKANSNGKVRMECAATIHFMRNTGWGKVTDACLQHTSVSNHQVAPKVGSRCATRGERILQACVCSLGVPHGSREPTWGGRIAMGIAHNELQWGKLVWTHLWIDHMYFFANKWRILSKFACFTMEGRHRRLKCMLRNSRGLSRHRGRLGLQVVLDNHTIDDSLAAHGWDATKRTQNWQGRINVQRYASRTRRRLLAAMEHLQTLDPPFQSRKKRI